MSSSSSKNPKIKYLFCISFFTLQFFNSPLLFSNPYLNEGTTNWKCEIKHECLTHLKNELNQESENSIYTVCQYEYDIPKNCCESLGSCPALYAVDQNIENIKSNLLDSSDNPAGCSPENMSNLINSLHEIQKDTCQLGAKNCKVGCDNKLDEFKRRIKNCFSITGSIDKALEQAKRARAEECHKTLIETAEKYKRQSLNGRSELREDLSAQDLVNCEGIKNKSNMALGAKKALLMCNQAGQKLMRRQEEEERLAREEKRQAELEKQKEEELARKQAELESRTRMIQADMGYTSQDKNSELLKAQDNMQAQDSGTKAQTDEEEGSKVKTVKDYLSEQVKKERANKEKNKEKEKSEKETKQEEKAEKERQEEKKKEDKFKPADKGDTNSKDKKKPTDITAVQGIRQAEGSKITPAVSAGAVQSLSLQTTKPDLKSLSKKTSSKIGKAKKTPSVKSKKLETSANKKETRETDFALLFDTLN